MSDGVASVSQSKSPLSGLIVATILCLPIACSSSSTDEPPDVDLTEVLPDVATAIRKARDRVLDEPKSAAAWGELGMTFMAHEIADPADECFAVAARLDDKKMEWSYLRGMIRWRSEPSTAVDYFKQAVERAPRMALPRFRYGEVLLDLGRLDEAADALREGLERDPSSPRGHRAMARLQLATDDIESSLESVRQSLEIDANSRDAHTLLAQIYFRLDRPEDAQNALEFVRKTTRTEEWWIDPIVNKTLQLRVGPRGMLARAQGLIQRQQFEPAMRILRAAAADGSGAEFSIELWRVLAMTGAKAEAVVALEEGLEQYPDSAVLHHLRGMEFYFAEDWTDAINWFRKALEKKPDYSEAAYYLGESLEADGQLDEAQLAYRDAARMRPSYAEAHHRLGRLLIEVDADNARRHLRLASELRPDDEAIQIDLAKLGEDPAGNGNDSP